MSDFESLLRARLAPSEGARPAPSAGLGVASTAFVGIAAAASNAERPVRPSSRLGSLAYREQSHRTPPRRAASPPELRISLRQLESPGEVEALAVFRAAFELASDTLSLSELRQAWRRLAKRLHPDRAPELGSQPFLHAQEAFRILRRRFN